MYKYNMHYIYIYKKRGDASVYKYNMQTSLCLFNQANLIAVTFPKKKDIV